MVKAGLYLGFDFGLLSIGVAVGQTYTLNARPLTSLKAQNGAPRWEEVAELIEDWQPVGLVVGMPLNMNGTEQPITRAARRFGRRLQGRFKIPVYEAEERLTTQEAKAHLFEQGGYRALTKTNIDSYSASLILSAWLKARF